MISKLHLQIVVSAKLPLQSACTEWKPEFQNLPLKCPWYMQLSLYLLKRGHENFTFYITVYFFIAFLCESEKWDIRMKSKAEISLPQKERSVNGRVIRLMWGILFSGETLAHIPERLKLMLWLGNPTVHFTLRGWLNWHVGILPGILQHISKKRKLPL